MAGSHIFWSSLIKEKNYCFSAEVCPDCKSDMVIFSTYCWSLLSSDVTHATGGCLKINHLPLS